MAAPLEELPPGLGNQSQTADDIEQPGQESSANDAHESPPIPEAPVPKAAVPQDTQPISGNRTKVWLIALAVMLVVIAIVIGLVVALQGTDTDTDTDTETDSTPPPPPSPLYSFSLTKMVNKSVDSKIFSMSTYAITLDASVGVTKSYVYTLKYEYNTSVFNMFQYTRDSEDFDMIEWWNTTLVSVDGATAFVNTTLFNALRTPELVQELGAEQSCNKEWLYSVTLDSTTTVSPPNSLQCNWGNAGLWSYQPGSSVLSSDAKPVN